MIHRPAYVVRQETEGTHDGGIEFSYAQGSVQKQGAYLSAAEQVVQIVVKFFQFPVFLFKFRVYREEFLIHGVQFLIGALQFFVGGKQFFIGALQFLVCGLQFFYGCLKVFSCGLKITFQFRHAPPCRFAVSVEAAFCDRDGFFPRCGVTALTGGKRNMKMLLARFFTVQAFYREIQTFCYAPQPDFDIAEDYLAFFLSSPMQGGPQCELEVAFRHIENIAVHAP